MSNCELNVHFLQQLTQPFPTLLRTFSCMPHAIVRWLHLLLWQEVYSHWYQMPTNSFLSPPGYCIYLPIPPPASSSVLFSPYPPSFHPQGEMGCSISCHFFFCLTQSLQSPLSFLPCQLIDQLIFNSCHLLTPLPCLFTPTCCGEPLLTLT